LVVPEDIYEQIQQSGF
jgi:hypothetical protein